MQPLSQPLRVVIADRSVALRRLIASTLSELPGFGVANIAATAELAIEQVATRAPDVLVIDVQMAASEVIEAARAASTKAVMVVLLASDTAKDTAAALDAMQAGAIDVVSKLPRGCLELELKAWVSDQLAPRVLAAARATSAARGAVDSLFAKRARPSPIVSSPVSLAVASASGRVPPKQAIRVVAIGASTGGPKALAQILPALPSEFPAPIVVVQHMPVGFTSLLASQLASISQLRVVEAGSGDALEVGTVYIAPGNRHLLVMGHPEKSHLELSDAPPEHSCRPAVDVLFRSVGTVFASRALGIVLTGMGQDGLQGAIALRAHGARVLAQDEASSVVWGMPGLVVRHGMASSRPVPLQRMAARICDEVLGLPIGGRDALPCH